MKEALRSMVEDKMGIRKPAPARDPETFVNPEQVRFNALPVAEQQELQWNAGNKSPELKEKAAKIVKKQKHADIWVKYLAAENDMYEGYFYQALIDAGYIHQDKVGTHSTGFDYLYVYVPPLCCPFCNKELPKGYKKET